MTRANPAAADDVAKQVYRCEQMSKGNPNGACIEKGVWTPLPSDPPARTNLVFTPSGSLAMTFHIVGCSGDPSVTQPGLTVAAGMAAQIAKPVSPAVAPSFLYHLGDIAYADKGSDTTGALWNTQFYAQYESYASASGPLPILAVAGNHDGKLGTPPDTEIGHFLQNMCGTEGTVSPDNQADKARTESTLPYPYWRLDTPLAWVMGLYSNVSNGGVLDDPTRYSDPTQGPQYKWLVEQLSWCKAQNATGTPRAILLAVHYPPYNGTLDFQQRGNPKYGNNNAYPNAVPLGMVLQSAFTQSGQIPDAIFSAHAHLYQRITLTYNNSAGKAIQQVPCFVVGCGGHTPLELMATQCAGGTGKFPAAPFNLFTKGAPPDGLSAPANATVMIEFYADGSDEKNEPYGFLTVTLRADNTTAHPTLVCQFFTTPCKSSGKPVKPGALLLTDSCTLDLTTHLLLS
jgi:Calcineurin-like phosphoesterase